MKRVASIQCASSEADASSLRPSDARFTKTRTPDPPRKGGGARCRGSLGVPTLWKSLNGLYRDHLGFRSSQHGRVGEKTKVERRTVLERALRDLVTSGMQLRLIRNLKAKHVLWILDAWRSRGLQASTMATYVSHLRVLCSWLNNPGLVDVIDRYVRSDPSLTWRRLVSNRDRSERGAGIDKDEILRLAATLDERFACQLRLIMTLGLRSQEAWLLRPHLAERQGHVCVNWGTKGGRPRTLPLTTTEQRVALEIARSFARTAGESTIPRGWTVQRWRHRYYWLLRKLGMTRAMLGVTPHSLRHGVLMDHFETLTGVPAPAPGGDLRNRDPFADRAARRRCGLRGSPASLDFVGVSRQCCVFRRRARRVGCARCQERSNRVGRTTSALRRIDVRRLRRDGALEEASGPSVRFERASRRRMVR